MDEIDNLSHLCHSLNINYDDISKREGTSFASGHLESLDLSSCGITKLIDGALDNFSALRVLDLSNNRFNSIPTGIFRNQKSMEELILINNKQLELPEGIFDSIRFIHLKIEGIFPNNLLQQQTKLSTLDLSTKKRLPEYFFSDLVSLRYLSLVTRVSLYPALFHGLNLQYLFIYEQRSRVLPDGIFEGLSSLTKLHLEDNEFTTLPDGLFDDLDDLKLLSLSRNNLKRLPKGIFDNLKELEELDLSHNRLSVLPQGILDNLYSLIHLDLSNNLITQLSYNNLTINFSQ